MVLLIMFFVSVVIPMVISGLSQEHLILGTKELKEKSLTRTFRAEQPVLPSLHRGRASILWCSGPSLETLSFKSTHVVFSLTVLWDVEKHSVSSTCLLPLASSICICRGLVNDSFVRFLF